VRNYYPASTDDEVLQEVWKIKDETAKRFRSVADYVRSLQRQSSVSHAMPKQSLQGTRRKRRTPEL
jgi:hypothetical protein